MDLSSFGVDVKKEQAPAQIISKDLDINMSDLKQTHKIQEIIRID